MIATHKPYAPACDRNREAIFEALDRFIEPSPSSLLEIGSGTGQHAVYFAQKLATKNLAWQPSDIEENLAGIRAWQSDEPSANCLPPLELDLRKPAWPAKRYDYLFTANTLHIVGWPLVEAFMQCTVQVLKAGGLCFIYGPFNYGGEYTSESNRDFDVWLKQRDPDSSIRDFEAVVELAKKHSPMLEILEDIAMPANNRLLVFQKHC